MPVSHAAVDVMADVRTEEDLDDVVRLAKSLGLAATGSASTPHPIRESSTRFSLTNPMSLGDATAWAESIDRSVLGSVAVPVETLAVAYLKYSKEALISLGYDVKMDNLMTIEYSKRARNERAYFDANPCVQSNGSLTIQSDAEVGMWLGLVVMPLTYVFGSDDDKADYTATRRYLSHMVGNPAVAAYYRAGIRGVEFIDSCIADGIDVELATSMYV